MRSSDHVRSGLRTASLGGRLKVEEEDREEEGEEKDVNVYCKA